MGHPHPLLYTPLQISVVARKFFEGALNFFSLVFVELMLLYDTLYPIAPFSCQATTLDHTFNNIVSNS